MRWKERSWTFIKTEVEENWRIWCSQIRTWNHIYYSSQGQHGKYSSNQLILLLNKNHINCNRHNSVWCSDLFFAQDAAAFWNQQPLAAREYAMATIIPACEVVADISKNSKDFIEKEVSAFFQSPDNTLYMLPATPQVFIFSPHRSDNNL